MVDDAQVGCARETLTEIIAQGVIDFDSDDFAGTLDEFSGEDAKPRADLDDDIVRGDIACADDFAEAAAIDEEVLGEAFFGAGLTHFGEDFSNLGWCYYLNLHVGHRDILKVASPPQVGKGNKFFYAGGSETHPYNARFQVFCY